MFGISCAHEMYQKVAHNILDDVIVHAPTKEEHDKRFENVVRVLLECIFSPKTFHGCQLVSQPTKPEPMTGTELPTTPWQHRAADLLGPLPSGDYVFVLVDYYSRLFETEFTKSTTSEKIVSMLSKISSLMAFLCP